MVKRLASKDRLRSLIGNFNKHFGDTVVSKINADRLREYQDEREAQGAAPRTIDYELSVVQTMLNRARKAGKVAAETVVVFQDADRALKKGANVRDRSLTLEEYLKIISGKYVNEKGEAKDISSPHLKAIVTVAFHTGMRQREILDLRWSHIDRKARMIRLPADMVKEKKPKRIPFNKYVWAVLEEQDKVRSIEHDFVFTYHDQPIHKLRRSFQNACERAKISYGRKAESGVTFHDIRGTFKTNALRAGVDPALRDVIVGHSLKGMDAHYIESRIVDDDLQAAMERFTAWYEAELRGQGLVKELQF